MLTFYLVRKWAVLFYVLSLNMKEACTENATDNSASAPSENEVKKSVDDQIRLFLYPNSNNISDRQELFLKKPESILNSNFSVNNPVKILVHGFNGDCRDLPFPTRALEEYVLLKQEGNSTANLICVDWEPFSRYDGIVNFLPAYILARISYTKQISGKVAKLIIFLRDAKMIKSFSDVHLVGESLGAHISGSVGLTISDLSGQKLGRISGLDPAGPLYREWPDLDEQLDKSDADFVDVYHTSMRRAGLEGKYGHADFYLNGGVNQPSCSEPNALPTGYAALSEALLGTCSHNIAGNYWADSIRRPNVTACNTISYANFRRIKKSKSGCDRENIEIFGEHCSTSARGKFFLDVNTTYTGENSRGPRGGRG